ncbi:MULTISPECIES: hypothetical protein [unclassified Mesorhizobium]|uniref:hypothetical protein n=1 Tax=unclassified Mesorhizobium TaxID=325217 RepID=UPI00086F2D90|nr:MULTISPECIES: hypothetical protein [unclassified Mesorhizobium]MBN9258701.1 hypothetical protein [Mesorhizobium sp.]MBN9271267.1 hypothetical protein [Mesorhizobium sp.]ODT19717.1 MAG: hypothetical protein ABS57_03120 [Mesorhizobium sp. SCN 65-12]OJX78735.1 MAG: hypothetical protein BGO93_18355 [Mesorhizobium sp. 65-26]
MRIASILVSIAIVGSAATGAFAAATSTTTTQPAATTTTTTTPPAKKATKAMTPEKTAISKQCSALADAKGLHGKDREKFRAACKKNGGKAPS